MKKKDILKTLDYSSYFSLIAASVLVLLYEFFGAMVLMRISVVLYGAAFLMLAVLCAMKLVYIHKETKEDDEVLVDKTKENRTWLIVRLAFAVLCFAFTVVFFELM